VADALHYLGRGRTKAHADTGLDRTPVTIDEMGTGAITEDNVFQEGYDAYWGGVAPDDNPYVWRQRAALLLG
jgi:hypothetical protein